MSLETLKREAAALDEPSQMELLSFLVELREREWAKWAREASKSLDDPNTEWLTLEEFKGRLDKASPPEDRRHAS